MTYEMHYRKVEGIECVTQIKESHRSDLSKAVVVAKTIAILIVSMTLFPIGTLVFCSLVNRMILEKVDVTFVNGNTFKGIMKLGSFYYGKHLLKNDYESERNSEDSINKWYLVSREGKFFKGQLNGRGKETYLYNDKVVVYECEYKDGVRTGFGTRTNGGDIVYKGWWQNGLMHGTGQAITKNGIKFDGEFRNNMFYKGTATHPNGRVFTGLWTEIN